MNSCTAKDSSYTIEYNFYMSLQRRFVIFVTLLSLLACRPVLTIGWGEFFFFGLILLVFAGPSLWRFYQRYQRFKENDKDEERS